MSGISPGQETVAPADTGTPGPAEGRRPGTLGWVAFVLALLGLAVSVYLTVEHYQGSTSLACPDTGTINCLKVTTSSYSTLLGIPVAVLGLVFYVAMTVLCAPPAWRGAARWLTRVRLLAAGLGVLFVLYLVWAELFGVGAICLWCTAVHAVTIALLTTLLLREALAPATAPDGTR